MKKMITSKLLYLSIRLVLGGLFVYAGATKIVDVDNFAMAIDGYGLVSWRMANLIAQVLPVIEILSGLGLILNVRGALGMIVAQLLGFVCVLSYGIYMGLDVDCGCFGPSDPGAGEPGGLWGTLIRDMFMLAACLFIYWQRRLADFTPRPLLRLFSLRKPE